jgi:hypothetical protein
VVSDGAGAGAGAAPPLDGEFVYVAPPPPELEGGATFGEPDADWRARSAVRAA